LLSFSLFPSTLEKQHSKERAFHDLLVANTKVYSCDEKPGFTYQPSPAGARIPWRE